MARQKHQESRDAERSRTATDETQAVDTPRKGETYRCEKCGMELEVTADCGSAIPEGVHFECCGGELMRV